MLVQKGFQKFGIIAQDYSFGKEAVDAFKKKLLQLNPSAKIVAEIYHPLGTKDYAPYASQLIAAAPDVIFTPNWGNDLTLLLKQGRPMGMKAKVASYYINDEVMIESLGDDNLILGDMGAEIYMISIPSAKNQEFIEKFYKDKGYYPTWLRGKADMGAEIYMLSIPSPKNQEFIEKFQKDKGYYPTWLRGKSYTATMFWAEAVKKAGSTDPSAVIKAWEGLSYDGPAGVWTMRACDHQAQVPYWSAEIVKDNKFFKHAFVGAPAMIPAKDVEVSCEETGCKMK